MSETKFEVEVQHAVSALAAIAGAKHPLSGFTRINYSIEACVAAAEITGADRTFCKLLNQEFRHAAVSYALGQAQGAVQ